MSTADKLNKLIETKEAIRQSIIAKGTDVGTDVPFSQYPSKIDNIQTVPVEYMNPEFFEMRTNGGTNFKGLFNYASGDNLDLSKWDVSKATDMSYMFNECSVTKIDLRGWDTSNVANTERMFYYFKGEVDISNLNFDKVNKCGYMVAYANLDKIKGLEDRNPVPNATSLESFFNSASKTDTLDLSKWDVSNVTNMNSLFSSLICKKLDLSNWKPEKVANMSSIFSFSYNNKTEELLIPDWDMSSVTSSNYFFGYSADYTKNLRYIDLSRSNDATISKIISYLPTRTETTYGNVSIPSNSSQEAIDALTAKYWRPIGPKLDLVSCEIVAELDEVLLGKTTKIHIGNCNPWYGDTENNFELVVTNDSVASIDENGVLIAHSLGSTEIYAVLKDTKVVISNTITITVAETDSDPYTIKFKGAGSPSNKNFIYLNGTNTANTVLLSSMDYNEISGVYTYDAGEPITYVKFNGVGIASYSNTCTDIVKLDTSNITNMENMLGTCSSLISLDLSNWDTSNVINMAHMFNGCTSLISLDLSNWDTSNVINMDSMFYNCPLLKNINGDIDLSSVIRTGSVYSNIFYDCVSLETASLINIYSNISISNQIIYSINLGNTKIKDECLISIISELPNLYDKGLTETDRIVFTLPPTNTLTADQVQPAIDKGWTVANVNSNVINEASTYSLRKPEFPNKVYRVIENENGNYQSAEGIKYEILEVNNAISPEGINVGWEPFNNIDEVIAEYNLTYIEPKEIEE